MPPFLSYLFEAAASPYGIAISTSDANGLRARLYTERRKLNNPLLNRLILSPSPLKPTEELWIINPPQEEADPGAEKVSDPPPESDNPLLRGGPPNPE